MKFFHTPVKKQMWSCPLPLFPEVRILITVGTVLGGYQEEYGATVQQSRTAPETADHRPLS